jgi:general secretion pathway protein G
MLLVLVILGILGAIVYPKISGQGERARKVGAGTQIRTFRTALARYEIENGGFPEGRAGLTALLERPRQAKNWQGPYLDGSLPKDPWGNEYLYECPGTHNRESYDLWSGGPDGVSGTEDDITNW